MRVLIRFLRRGQAGAVEGKERLFDGEVVTLGRSTDQVLHLKDRRVALKHARIAMRAGRTVISSSAPAGIVVNDALCREASLKPGDTIRIGANVLRVLDPPRDVDLAFSFELDAEVAATTAGFDPKSMDLEALGLSKRPWSWLAFAAVLALSLVIPATGLLNRGLNDTLRAGPAPDDGYWLSGPLSSVHHNLGEQCEACHQTPFQRVQNAACVDCHATVGRHFPAATKVAAFDTTRCAACHAEHNEPATLVRRDDALCTDCHADIAVIAGTLATTENVADFHDRHPPFDPQPAAPERLKFPHDTHLDSAGIEGPKGDVVMSCGDCHRPQDDGLRMKPVTMEEHCSSCHRLDFDPAFPDATVPHVEADIVLRRLIEYYSRSYLEEYPDPEAKSGLSRRAEVPGREPNAREREQLLRRARDRAFTIARDLIERRTCVDCHEIENTGEAENPWRVVPAQLQAAWFPAARFSHARHATELSGCDRCHAAKESHMAGDVLMPVIGDCRECHGSGDPHRNPEGLVQSACTLCHGFHDAAHGAWTSSAGQ